MPWDGLKELYEGLRALPANLRAGAGPICIGKAEQAAGDIREGYPRRTSNLADHVIVKQESAGQFGVAVVVKNTAKHASLFENGTQARHTDLGANRGSMPPGHVFVPAVEKRRGEMVAELRALLESHGLTVTGG